MPRSTRTRAAGRRRSRRSCSRRRRSSTARRVPASTRCSTRRISTSISSSSSSRSARSVTARTTTSSKTLKQAAEERPGAEHAQGADLQRVRRHGPLPARRSSRHAGIEGVEEIDGDSKVDRADIIRRFAPYYNESSSAQLRSGRAGRNPRPDLDRHPVGRPEPSGRDAADQLRPALEPGEADAADRPRRSADESGGRGRRLSPIIRSRGPLRGKVAYWNFLPPKELDALLAALPAGVAQDAADLQDARHRGQEAAHGRGRLRGAQGVQRRVRGQSDVPRADAPGVAATARRRPGLDDQLERAARFASSAGGDRPKAGPAGVFFCYTLPALDTETGAC